MTTADQRHSVVLFDGECAMCNRSVRFFVRHDPCANLRFAPRESDLGRRMIEQAGLEFDAIDSIVLIEQGVAHVHSAAVWRIARQLKGFPKLLALLRFIPAPLRDWGYRSIAKRRHAWPSQACPLDFRGIEDRMLTDQ